mgnify:CR=1 FL=1
MSSSSRPFQGSSNNQFFITGDQIITFDSLGNVDESSQKSSDKNESIDSDVTDSRDFTTPDSGLEDSESASPLEKKPETNCQPILLEMNNLQGGGESKDGTVNILDNLKFNFAPDVIEATNKKSESKRFMDGGEKSSNESNGKLEEKGSSSPLSPSGLGELRHTRGRLKLDLSFNHNTDLGGMMNKKINRIH